MSPLTDAMIINGAVLIAVLEGDLGSHRKIGRVRILRPLLTVAAVIPLFLDRPVTHGHGLLVELAGIAVGLLCGLVVTMLMRVYRSPRTGRPVSAAGFPYTIVWTVIVAARAVFSIGATNWFPAQLAQWCAAHQVTGAAITDGLIFMAITMVLVRTLGLYTRAIRLPAAPAPARSGLSSFARLFAQWPEARADLFGKSCSCSCTAAERRTSGAVVAGVAARITVAGQSALEETGLTAAAAAAAAAVNTAWHPAQVPQARSESSRCESLPAL